MTRKKKKKQTTNKKVWIKLLIKIFRFFFPKDWKAELQKGKEIGSSSGIAKAIGGGIFGLGKAARKKVDPEHKMKIGNQRRKKNGNS